MNSLDGISRASAPHFFYGRLKAGMYQSTNKAEGEIRLWRPAYLLTGLALICILNVMMLVQSKKNWDVPFKPDRTGIENFASEYSFSENINMSE